METSRAFGLLAAACLVVACAGEEPGTPAPAPGQGGGGGSGGTGGEGGTGGIPAGIELTPPALPAPAEPPLLTPCPAGWAEVEHADGRPGCDPGPAGPDCPVDQARFPGEPGCRPIGAPCAGEWADDLLPGAPVLYVRAGAAPGGDGSRAAPYATIDGAAAYAGPGDVIAVGQGTYDEVVGLGNRVTLHGACVAGTRIASSLPHATEGTVRVLGSGVEVRGLQLGGARRGLTAIGDVSVTVEGVAITGATLVGLHSDRGTITAHNLIIRDTQGLRGSGTGVYAGTGGTVELSRTAIERSYDMGVATSGSTSTVHLSDSVVRATGTGDYRNGAGLWTTEARITLTRSLLEENRVGMTAEHGGGLVSSDSVIRGSREGAVLLRTGGQARLTRSAVIASAQFALVAYDEGSALVLEDVLVAGTRSHAGDGERGIGLGLFERASARFSRVAFSGAKELGLFAHGAGTSLTGTDLIVEDVDGQESDGSYGYGIVVTAGARAELARLQVERVRAYGIAISFAGAEAVLSDVVVRDMVPDRSTFMPRNGQGIGLLVHEGAAASLSRVRIERSIYAGIVAMTPLSTIDAGDVTITGNRSVHEEGFAIALNSGATGRFDRVRLDGNEAFGAGAFEATLALSEAEITGTAAAPCDPGSCEGSLYGTGVISVLGSSVTLTGFSIRGSALCGVQVASEGVVDLHHGEVVENTVGVNVQTEGFDVSRLEDDVVYARNGRDLDSAELPLPELALDPAAPPEG